MLQPLLHLDVLCIVGLHASRKRKAGSIEPPATLTPVAVSRRYRNGRPLNIRAADIRDTQFVLNPARYRVVYTLRTVGKKRSLMESHAKIYAAGGNVRDYSESQPVCHVVSKLACPSDILNPVVKVTGRGRVRCWSRAGRPDYLNDKRGLGRCIVVSCEDVCASNRHRANAAVLIDRHDTGPVAAPRCLSGNVAAVVPQLQLAFVANRYRNLHGTAGIRMIVYLRFRLCRCRNGYQQRVHDDRAYGCTLHSCQSPNCGRRERTRAGRPAALAGPHALMLPTDNPSDAESIGGRANLPVRRAFVRHEHTRHANRDHGHPAIGERRSLESRFGTVAAEVSTSASVNAAIVIRANATTPVVECAGKQAAAHSQIRPAFRHVRRGLEQKDAAQAGGQYPARYLRLAP